MFLFWAAFSGYISERYAHYYNENDLAYAGIDPEL